MYLKYIYLVETMELIWVRIYVNEKNKRKKGGTRGTMKQEK